MQAEMQVLIWAAITVSFLHTLAGPDHYLPFIALSRSRGWSMSKTLLWTIGCGCGHVLSSVLLGLAGAAIGWSMSSLKWMESVRGGIAGWSLLIFGLAYTAWGIMRARKNKSHRHFDFQDDGSMYVYEHQHGQYVTPKEKHRVTPWVMFLIFVLGPCEPMIPLLYVPAAQASWWSMVVLVLVYTFFTLATMTVMVVAGYYGTAIFKTEKLEKYMGALGGLTILICGTGMVFLNW
ncbi:MAG: sulfite exporter TauE/SafE family protein [Chitinophagaceae bacterium]